MADDSHGFTRDPLIRAFGATLRAHRQQKSLSRAELAESLGCTPQWIEKMETGTKPSLASAIDLDTYFDLATKNFQTIAAEIENTGRHRASPPPGFDLYLELEATASRVQIYGPLLIEGLFQTEGYARATLEPTQPPDFAEEFVAKRMRRQGILSGDKPTWVWATFDERALCGRVGDFAIMRAQLEFLLELAKRPNIMIDVVPQDVGYYQGLEGGFILLGFDDRPDVVYVEAAGRGQVIEHSAGVADYQIRYNLIRGHARSVTDSRELIESIMESL